MTDSGRRDSFCRRCGAPLEEAADFCSHCGFQVLGVPAAESDDAEGLEFTVQRSTLRSPGEPAVRLEDAEVVASESERPVATPMAASPVTVNPVAASSGTGDAEGVARIGSTTFPWPVPNREVAVGGRTLNLEVAVVAAVYAIGALWLLWSVHDVFRVIPDVLRGLGGNEFEFVFAWLGALILAILAYVIGMLAATSWLLFRGDPVGTGLSVIISVTLVLATLSSLHTTSMVLIMLISVACSASLLLSPWVRRSLAAGDQLRRRPGSVALSQALGYSFFGLATVVGVAMLPGLRFSGDLGAHYVIWVVLDVGAGIAGIAGCRRLRDSPDRGARLMVSAACAVFVIAFLTGNAGSVVVIMLGILGGIALPLWLSPKARAWFGDPPITLAQTQ